MGFLLISEFVKNRNNFPFISTIIDKKHSYIQIQTHALGIPLIWKDSYRIFSVSLDSFCKTMGVPGKTSKYRLLFNSFRLFNFKNIYLI
jgi:hypothetical protein